MKQRDMLLIGGAGILAYYLLKKTSQTAPPSNFTDDVAANITGAVNQALSGLQQTQNTITSAAQNAAIGTGGALSQIMTPFATEGLTQGVISAVANSQFLNQLFGSNLISATLYSTPSGSGNMYLSPSAGLSGGALNSTANAAIDAAINAITAPTYGVELAAGGTTVFNITPQGTPATSIYTPAVAPIYTASYIASLPTSAATANGGAYQSGNGGYNTGIKYF